MADQLPDAWLSRDPLPADPVPILRDWLAEAFEAQRQPNPHAVALATVDPDGKPSVRMVLCNEIDVARGAFTMYTNLESRKARALRAHPQASIVFYWGPHDRQARVEGPVGFTPAAQCDAYFATRPLDAKINAWASRQSEPVESRAALLAVAQSEARRFGVASDARRAEPIPRPPFWGGYTLVAESVELWVSRPGRIHDRALWRRSLADEPGPWRVMRLQP